MTAVTAVAQAVLVSWSEFDDASAKTIRRQSGYWRDLIDRLRKAHGFTSKRKCPWVKLAIFGDLLSDKGSLRHDANVLQITGVEGDYDGEVIQPEAGIAKLEAAGIRAVVYTSPSHTADKPRWRVLALCSKPLQPGARAALVARINGVLGGVLASESFTLSQSYYFGQVEGADYRVLVAFNDPDQGEYIDLLDELDDGAIGKRTKSKTATSKAEVSGSGERDEDEFAETVAMLGRLLITGDGRREMFKSFITSLSARGLSADHIKLRVEGVVARYCDPADPPSEVDTDGIVLWATERDAASVKPSVENFGDIANGKRFARKFSGQFLFVHAVKRWLRWDAMRWAECGNGEALKAAGLIAQDALDDAHAALKADPTEKAKGNHSQALSVHRNVRRLEAMLIVAGVQDGMSIANPGLLDADPWLLGVRNGVVNLRTGTLLQPDPSMLISRQAGAAFEPNARCDRWLKFLAEVFCGDAELIAFVRRAVGYSLTGLTDEEIAFLLFGEGANGKSVFANILQGVFGEYAVTVRACLLARDGKGGSSDAEREKARLPGARLALINEVGIGDLFDDQRFKESVSRERISARMLYSESFDFYPTHKIWLRGNHPPGVLDSGDAFWRRIALTRFERQFAPHERVADLDRRILESERDGVLAWAVQGCLEWQRDGLQVPKTVRAASDDYRRDTDQLGEWIEGQCRSAPGASTPVSRLFDSYATFLQQGHMRPPSRVAFSRQLRQRGYKLARTSQARLVEGLALAASEGWVDVSDDEL